MTIPIATEKWQVVFSPFLLIALRPRSPDNGHSRLEQLVGSFSVLWPNHPSRKNFHHWTVNPHAFWSNPAHVLQGTSATGELIALYVNARSDDS